MTDDKLTLQAEEFVSVMPRLMRALFALDEDDPAMELPLAQIRVCTILRDGPQSMSTIGREMGITLSAMTQIADRLERHGMVERICETEDRRVKCLQLTHHGREVMYKRKEKRLQRIRQVLEKLEPKERESVIAALESLQVAASLTPEETVRTVSEQLEII